MIYWLTIFYANNQSALSFITLANEKIQLELKLQYPQQKFIFIKYNSMAVIKKLIKMQINLQF